MIAVTVSPNAQFVCTANWSSNDVSAFTVDAAGRGPQSLAVHPSGQFAYVMNYASNDVSAYATNISAYLIDGSTGGLTPLVESFYLTGEKPASVTTTAGPVGPLAF